MFALRQRELQRYKWRGNNKKEKGKIFTDNKEEVLKNKHNAIKILSDTQKKNNNNATLIGQGNFDMAQDPEDKINAWF